MANQIILKRSATPGKVPTTAQLALGEIGINTYDGLIYIKKDDGTPSVVQIGGVTSVNGETGAITISSDDVSDSGQTNKWFSNALARGAVSAGTGISYNSSTGVISTSQSITSSASPTFAGLTLTGSMGITGDIIPSADITYDLGSPTKQWKDVYVGPGSLYVNGSKVLEDNSGTITFTADTDQNIRINTVGAGILQLGSSTTNVNVDGTLQIASGKNITDSAGIKVNFGDNIEMNGNKVIGLGAPSSNNDAATKLYVDTAIGAVSTSSIASGNSNISVVDSGTGTVTVTVDGSTALTVDATGVVVAGNFTVSGTTTTVNSNTVSVADNILTLNSDATGAPTQNAGIEVERGDEANVQIRWNEGSDTWTFTNDGAVYHPMATGTDTLAEGSTNLYHTTARARSAISSSSATGVSYNSSTGVVSLGSIPNSSLANNSITINGTSVALGGTRTLDTDSLAEGTNLFFTDARARGAVSAGTGIAYNSTSGSISTNAIPNASLTNSSVTIGSTSVSLGATAGTVAGLTLTSPTINAATIGGHLIPSTDVIYDLGDATHRFRDLYLSGSTIKLGTATLSAVGTGLALGGSAVVTVGDTGTVTNTMLAGSIANAKLVNSSTTIGTTAIALGASSTTLAGLTSVTSTGFTGALSGNATTATTLATARNIQGVSFNGSADITVVTAGTGISVSGTAVTNTGVTSAVAGTGVGVSAATGAVTFSIGQAVATTSTPTFAGLTNAYERPAANGVTAFQLQNATGTSILNVDSTNNRIGINNIAPAAALHVTGAGLFTGEITAYYSDLRLKTNIVPIADALDKVEAINGVTFDPNETALGLGIDDRHQMGVIAQEVEAVAPELVCDSAFAGYKTVRYDKLTALLIEAVKELSAKVKTLEAQLGNTKPQL